MRKTIGMRTRPVVVLLLAAVAAVLAPACGGASSDPRCVALCTINEPSTPDAGDICSQASADACREQCGAQIQDEPTVCADCLLEGAYFGLGTDGGGNECQTSVKCPATSLCSDSGPGGQCDYCEGDAAAESACYKKAHPRREVECKADFRDPVKCASACAAK